MFLKLQQREKIILFFFFGLIFSQVGFILTDNVALNIYKNLKNDPIPTITGLIGMEIPFVLFSFFVSLIIFLIVVNKKNRSIIIFIDYFSKTYFFISLLRVITPFYTVFNI